MSYVGGHFGNLCNLKCRICSSDFSSQIAAEDIKYGDDIQAAQARQKIKIGRWSKKSTDFWQYLANTPTIKNFEFLGGEPFLLKELIGYVENLALSGHSRDCMFDIVTNGTVVPDVIIKHHSKFKRIGITFSIDDIEDRFELQRKNATWHEVNQNIRMMSNLDNVHARCNTTVNVMNVYYLPELIDWWHTIDSSENLHISTGLTNPAHLDIAHMPKKAADAVYDKLYASPHRLLLQPILDKLSNTSTDMSKDFITYTKFKDTIRNENFANSHPEIAALYNY
jgi:sulfatase maturation enzyme AslB (radical SAM superfamily)